MLRLVPDKDARAVGHCPRAVTASKKIGHAPEQTAGCLRHGSVLSRVRSQTGPVGSRLFHLFCFLVPSFLTGLQFWMGRG